MEGFPKQDIFPNIIESRMKEVHTKSLILKLVVFALFHGFNSRQQILDLHYQKWVLDRTNRGSGETIPVIWKKYHKDNIIT